MYTQRHTVNEAFRHQIIYPKETKFPVKQISQNSFLFVQESDLFVVGVTRQNADVAVIFEVLHTFIKNCKLYFGGDFDEESVRGNFLLVYEILEGTIHFARTTRLGLNASFQNSNRFFDSYSLPPHRFSRPPS